MSTITEAIRLVIEGDSSGAVKALGEVADGAAKTQDVFGKYSEGLNKASNYAAAGVVAGAAVIAKSVYDTQQSYSAIKELMRMTGDSAEQASTLTGQWDATGLSIEEGSVAMKKFSQNLAAVYNGTAKTNPFGELGVSVTDANGEMRDSAAVLADVQAAMSALDNPTQRTAVAIQMFGKSGDDLLSWLTKTPAELDALNKKLKDAGLVWSDKDIAAYADAAAAQRDLQISLKGVEQTIARDVVPAMTPFVQLLGSALRFLRPLAPVIVPATAALAVFVGVVKGAMIVQSAWNGALSLLPARLGRAKVAQVGFGTSTIASTAALKAQMITLGMYGIALAAAAVAIYGIVKAYQSWQQAAQQAAAAAAGAQATLDANASKLDPAFVAQQQAAINADKYKSPQGVSGWLGAAFQGMWNYNPLVDYAGLKHFGSGGDFIARGAQQIVVGDNPAGERVTVTPLNRNGAEDEFVLKASRFAKGNADKGSVLVTGNTFVGTSRDAERTLTNIVSRRLGPQTARLGRGRMAMASG